MSKNVMDAYTCHILAFMFEHTSLEEVFSFYINKRGWIWAEPNQKMCLGLLSHKYAVQGGLRKEGKVGSCLKIVKSDIRWGREETCKKEILLLTFYIKVYGPKAHLA